MTRSAIIEIHKDELKFSAGHFMLLSDKERESMHGHDYQVNVAFNTLITHNGMAFDCRLYKQRLVKLCQSLDYHFILPSLSEYMRIEETNDTWKAYFDNQTLSFAKKDVVVLPIVNVTLEELSYWFLQQLTENPVELQNHHIQGLTVRVFNGRGESGTAMWGNHCPI